MLKKRKSVPRKSAPPPAKTTEHEPVVEVTVFDNKVEVTAEIADDEVLEEEPITDVSTDDSGDFED
jgi:hypothetical protein